MVVEAIISCSKSRCRGQWDWNDSANHTGQAGIYCALCPTLLHLSCIGCGQSTLPGADLLA